LFPSWKAVRSMRVYWWRILCSQLNTSDSPSSADDGRYAGHVLQSAISWIEFYFSYLETIAWWRKSGFSDAHQSSNYAW
jgi:hypothetical protein